MIGVVSGSHIGSHIEGKEAELAGLLDELLKVETPEGNEYNTEAIGNILTDLIGAESPALLFLGFTHQGMELGPAVAYRRGIPLVTGCIDFEIQEEKATVKRLMHGGKVSVSLEVAIAQGAVFSIQKGALKEVDADSPGDPTVPLLVKKLEWKESWASAKSQVLEIIRESIAEGEDITKARILVSVGRGLGNQDNLPMIRELANLLGGMVSCSRPVVDLGWLPSRHQVGLSGKTVTPVIYLALAISGQGNHIVGMETSKIIIAVNKDSHAPIFQIAHYGVIDDIQHFVPQMLDYVKKEEG